VCVCERESVSLEDIWKEMKSTSAWTRFEETRSRLEIRTRIEKQSNSIYRK